MFDLIFDPIKRDLVFAENGDIATSTDNSVISTQNGTILLEGRAMNILQPAYGIGFNSQVQGGDEAQAAFQLNRWVSQCQSDGGSAQWIKIPNPPNTQFDFEAAISYNQ